jgi:LysM repeat protein
MKTLYTLYCFVVGILLAQSASAQIAEKRIFFPYFRATDSPALAMPLAHQNTQILVDIDGIRAKVKVHQLYQNTTQNSLTLSCVVPTDIDALRGEMNQNEVVKKPNLPKNVYVEAKQPLFMPAIPADASIELMWEYTIICEKENNLSSFRLPAFVSTDENIKLHYDLRVQFHTEYPLQDISSQEHLIEVHYPTSNTAEVVFAQDEKTAGTRPFVLSYRVHKGEVKIAQTPKNEEGVMRGDAPKEDYVVTHEGKKEDEVADLPTKKITQYYEVKDHDYLEKIADKYGVTTTDIRHWNHLKEHAHLHKGQTLKLEVPCVQVLHTVEEDEYPYQIAQLYGVNVNELLEWNNLKNTDRLSIGQKIIIYQVKR